MMHKFNEFLCRILGLARRRKSGPYGFRPPFLDGKEFTKEYS